MRQYAGKWKRIQRKKNHSVCFRRTHNLVNINLISKDYNSHTNTMLFNECCWGVSIWREAFLKIEQLNWGNKLKLEEIGMAFQKEKSLWKCTVCFRDSTWPLLQNRGHMWIGTGHFIRPWTFAGKCKPSKILNSSVTDYIPFFRILTPNADN